MDATATRHQLEHLHAPQRNNYFYGKLLDVTHFQMEQTYLNRKRWLLNRLGLGKGVLCGLEVSISEDKHKLWIAAGVAIDGLGREIVVPDSICIDPWQATDACGRPDSPIPTTEDGWVYLCLAYRECYAEYSPALVSDCNTHEQCKPGTIVECYDLLVQRGKPEPIAPDKTLCEALHSDLAKRYQVLAAVLDSCPGADDPPCVVLAAIHLLPGGVIEAAVDASNRRVIASNEELLDLILCLAERCGDTNGQHPVQTKRLEYISGDNQHAAPGETLSEPLVVRVTQDGIAAEGKRVTFRIIEGDGKVGRALEEVGTPRSIAIPTDVLGRATLPIWELGPDVGINRVSASIDGGTPGEYTFHATADAPLVQTKRLEYVSGDSQQTVPGGMLGESLPFVVRVTQGGIALKNELVIFDMIEGGGQIGEKGKLQYSFQVPSPNDDADDGIVSLPLWQLGPLPILNRVKSYIALEPSAAYTFTAMAHELMQVKEVELILVKQGKTNTQLITPEKNDFSQDRDGRLQEVRITFNQLLDTTTVTTITSPQSDPHLASIIFHDRDRTNASQDVDVMGTVDWSLPKVVAFTPSNGYFARGAYTLVVYGSSGDDAGMPIKSSQGVELDGDSDQIPGGDYEITFIITA